ncbi:MAG: molybdenum cofactor guanylyltransferase [Rhodocyclales bacterium]|nr:molybdenum cofactor guanylyltransferase [Rhodocyclales bacterium]
MDSTREKISGVILAGGQGRRMGGVDKGLIPLHGKPMVAWVIERLRPQVDELAINANQNLDHYRALGETVYPDEIGGFIGPLAGLHAALSRTALPLVITAPCDSPFLPADLVTRLGAALVEHGADLAVACTDDQRHPVFSLCRRTVLPALTAYLASGGRKMDGWYAPLKHIDVSFDDQPLAFRNINTRGELDELER